MSDNIQSSQNRWRWLPGISAALPFVLCNLKYIVLIILPTLGASFAINPHLQAALVSLLAAMTFGFALFAYRSHRQSAPVVTVALGAVTIIGSMYIYFDKIVESAGLVLLIVGAIWNWRVMRSEPKPAIHRDRVLDGIRGIDYSITLIQFCYATNIKVVR